MTDIEELKNTIKELQEKVDILMAAPVKNPNLGRPPTMTPEERKAKNRENNRIYYWKNHEKIKEKKRQQWAQRKEMLNNCSD
jgi:hypothetical protein